MESVPDDVSYYIIWYCYYIYVILLKDYLEILPYASRMFDYILFNNIVEDSFNIAIGIADEGGTKFQK